ncbi:DDE-type integrase/transposase/recombinase, partial [Rhizobium ruizarguesonis]
IDKHGNPMDFLLTAKRDLDAAKRFFRKMLKHEPLLSPNKIGTNGANTFPSTIKTPARDNRALRKCLRQARLPRPKSDPCNSAPEGQPSGRTHGRSSIKVAENFTTSAITVETGKRDITDGIGYAQPSPLEISFLQCPDLTKAVRS